VEVPPNAPLHRFVQETVGKPTPACADAHSSYFNDDMLGGQPGLFPIIDEIADSLMELVAFLVGQDVRARNEQREFLA
jgi:hypothetical protein